MDGGERVKRRTRRRRQMGEKEQEKVIKGGKDKANWAGRSFVMTPLNGSRNLWEWRGKLTNANVKSQIVRFYLTVTSVSGDWQTSREIKVLLFDTHSVVWVSKWHLCDRKMSFNNVQINSYYSHLELQSLLCQTQHDSPCLERSLMPLTAIWLVWFDQI